MQKLSRRYFLGKLQWICSLINYELIQPLRWQWNCENLVSYFSPLKLDDIGFVHLVSQTSVVLESHNISTAPDRLFNKSSCAGVMISVMRVTNLTWPRLWTLHKSGGLRPIRVGSFTGDGTLRTRKWENMPQLPAGDVITRGQTRLILTWCDGSAESPSVHVKDSGSWNTQSKFMIGKGHKLHDKKCIHRLWLMISILHISYLDMDKVFPFIH